MEEELEEVDEEPIKNSFNLPINLYKGKAMISWHKRVQIQEECLQKLPNEFRKGFKINKDYYFEDDY